MLPFTLDAEPDPVLAEHYKKSPTDQKWYLDGYVPRTEHEQFRNNNIALKKEREDIEKKFADVDLEEYKKLKSTAELFKDGKLIKADDLEGVVATRLQKFTAEHTTALTAVQQRAEAAEKQVATYMIDGELQKAGAAAGIRKEAIEDLMLRGRGAFAIQDGKVVCTLQGAAAFGVSGQPLTIEEYVAGLTKSAPHFFEPSSGSGAASQQGGGAGATGNDNPYMHATWNVTKQAMLASKDPAKAAAMKNAALAKGEGTPPKRKF